MSEHAITLALSKRYEAPAWAFLPQVRNGTGYGSKTRTADALAFSLYPSRGLDLHGFEIKCSKSDLKAELNDPSKADEIGKCCDFWWLAVSDAKITSGFDIPDCWGVLVMNGDTLKLIKQARKLDPTPMTRSQICAIMRNINESTVPKNILNQLVEERVKGEREGWVENTKRNYDHIGKTLNDLRENVRRFEEKSGIRITEWSGWNNDQDAEAFKALRDLQGRDFNKELISLGVKADSISASINRILKATMEGVGK